MIDKLKFLKDHQGFMKYCKNTSKLDGTMVKLTDLLPLEWNLTIMQKVRNEEERKFYIEKSIDNGWSQTILVHQIESNLYVRSSKEKVSNFGTTLVSPHSELAQQTLKDPYIFDFLLLSEKAKERDIAEQLVQHITKFLLELGAGFAFVGNQYKLEIGDKEYYIDLLFYHLKLQCYFVIELKNVAFKPEFAEKLDFYLSVVDDLVKSETDNPTIRLILCKTKNKVEAEYSLRDINKPIGISEYQISESIPDILKSKLPSIKEIEEEFENE
ncbi:MAG: hypothetical protein COB07_04900 [Sulfurovum sp.]|nr:MAG: hypothetical protein COB07_04900 [Sulfurovum sp.]